MLPHEINDSCGLFDTALPTAGEYSSQAQLPSTHHGDTQDSCKEGPTGSSV